MPLFLVAGLLGLTYGTISGLISKYSYLAIFVLMTLESASLPVPSEVVLPAVGYFVKAGSLDFMFSLLTALLAGIVGMGIDYFIAYYLGKAVVYKHLSIFHVTKKRIRDFDSWFSKNAGFAIFVSRLLPVVRGLMSFPAGFAEMPLLQFYLYSIPSTIIWDVLLMGFGYYALSMSNRYLVIGTVILFFLVLYAVYRLALRRIK